MTKFADRIAATPLRVKGGVLLIFLTVLLVGMAAREHLRRVTGQEIVLAARPVDPRDLLRGAYVTLAYQAEQLLSSEIPATPDIVDLDAGDPVYLTLRREGEIWSPARLSASRTKPAGEDEAVLKARLVSKAITEADGRTLSPQTYLIDIGADRYFADEAGAKALEASVREGELSMVLSVDGAGKPVIKGLIVAGARRDESFF